MGASNYPGLAHAKPAPKTRDRRVQRKADQKHLRTVYDVVDERDKERCQLTGRRGNKFSVDPLDRIHHNHIEQRGRDQGPDESWNLVSVTRDVHDLIHQNRIVVTGNADEALAWTLKADTVVELWGREAIPYLKPSHFAVTRTVRVIPDDEWDAFIRGEARLR